MILKVGGVFILAFVLGYIVAGLANRIKRKKAASNKLKKVDIPFSPEKNKAERLN